ncbi:MAG TPA: DUF349 domain-containing protein [Bacteroidales bacterium]|nr:DUF349 domain-containing protein [Bacteroidales bacterium]HOK74884.1 DUF349 domain-containing protein [Bacteroidales bacterium]HOM40201.1 DUF349 domain-containing protein [Bacteroidales bacterium]HPP91698.1 DUF349 domain-containing protein [Bacteroidales bacterium]HRR15555.1 DUF349 domain-containing protein [Bacteroidales bacterium]
MIEKDPNNPVLNEQFAATEGAGESTGNVPGGNIEPPVDFSVNETEKPESLTSDEKKTRDGEVDMTEFSVSEKKNEEKINTGTESVPVVQSTETAEASEDLPDSGEHISGEDKAKRPRKKSGEKKSVSPVVIPETSLAAERQGDIPEDYKDIELPPVDYSGYSKEKLVETLELIIDNRPPNEIKNDVERIKSLFYKKIRKENEERKKKFLEEGGKAEDYRVLVDPLEVKVKELLEKYKSKKSDYGKIQEAEKLENLRKKYEIIEKIKDLVNREESINKTFQEFRALQNEWHAVGIVPQSALKDLWENYHHAVEIFYDYIKINKELRDLDLKKNLEAKVRLCEKAEELMLEPNPVTAFKLLQDLHNAWREIGPVPHESKNEIWERFKEATAKINKRHHEFFEKQKEEQKKNLEAKIALCEKVEEINREELKTFKDFEEKAKIVINLQKMWRTIGFAPKKQNNKIYQRFREACDAFFEKKRNFYADSKEMQMNNLQRKTDLCIQAEALQESTDWKATTEALIRLQKEWKEIGPVPRKYSDKIWKRFRKACDHFFNRKAEYFASLDSTYEENLKAKEAIIAELENFEPGDDVQEAFNKLKEIQKRWTDIGFVPFNRKEEINNRYRNALNKQFDKLKIDEVDKSILKYKTKLETLKSNPKALRKLSNEREKFISKIKQLENDIVLWENNIGFFAKSPNAETMIKEVEEKIKNAKKTIKTLEEKVKLIDRINVEEL